MTTEHTQTSDPLAERPNRPNFFLLLGLSPNGDWNQTLFEETLRRKRNEWSRAGSGVAKKALTAKQNLALIPKITEVMTNPELREAEALAAREELASRRARELEQFESQLALLNAKNPAEVDEEERAQFVTAYSHLLPSEDIRARLAAPPPPPTPPVPDADAWEAILTSIADRLQMVQLHSLYELLQKPTSTSTGELRQEASALYGRLVRQSPSAEATVKMELTGLARSVFKNDETRTRYDAMLREAGLRTVLEQLDESMSRAKRQEVHAGQVRVFLHEAKKHGWSEADALQRLQDYAAQKHWAMMSMTAPQTPTLQQERTEPAPPAPQRAADAALTPPPTKRTTTAPLPAVPPESTQEPKQVKEVKEVKEPVVPPPVPSQERASRDDKPRKHHDQTIPQPPPAALAAPPKRLPDPTVMQQVLERVSIGRGKQGICMSWPVGPFEQLVVIISPQAVERGGTVLTEAELAPLGRLSFLQASQGHGEVEAVPGHLAYYTPVLITDGHAYLGKSLPYLWVEPVRDLHAQIFGAVIRLRWHWPTALQAVQLSYAARSTLALRGEQTVQRERYEQQGYYDLPIEGGETCLLSTDWDLRVSSCAPGETSADGCSLVLRFSTQTVLTYHILPPTLWRKQPVLQILLDLPKRAPLPALPALVLVSRQGALPRLRSDGELFARIEAVAAPSGKISVPLPHKALPPHTYGKLFLEDETRYSDVLIHHPSHAQMRLS